MEYEEVWLGFFYKCGKCGSEIPGGEKAYLPYHYEQGAKGKEKHYEKVICERCFGNEFAY